VLLAAMFKSLFRVKLNPGRCGFQLAEFCVAKHAAPTSRVLFRETILPFSSDDLQLVRYEVASITFSDGKKQHV
jgi:hypothetical protein